MAAPEGAPLYFLFALAEHLNKTVEEVRSLSEAEINGWRAYFSAKRKLKEE